MLLRALSCGLIALLLISGPTLAADIVIQQGTPLSLAEVVTGGNGDTVSINQAGTFNGARSSSTGLERARPFARTALRTVPASPSSATPLGRRWVSSGDMRAAV